MALTDENGMVMPVQPMANYGMPYGGGNGLFGGSDSWLGILFLIALCNGGFGFGGFGGGWGAMGMMGGMYGMDYLYPWLNNSQNINDGFRSQQITTQISDARTDINRGFGDVQLGIAGVNQNVAQGFANTNLGMCQGFNSVNNAIYGAQNAISQQMYNNEIANLNRSFAEQTATAQGFNGVQAGIADTKFTIATEECATRNASAMNTRDIIDSNNRGTQAILDKLCQLELDGVKAQVEVKNDRIAELQTQLNMANLAASQTAQNAFIAQGFANEVDQLYNRLSSCPVPSTPVYGRTPIFTCQQNANSGCGCGNGFAN